MGNEWSISKREVWEWHRNCGDICTIDCKSTAAKESSLAHVSEEYIGVWVNLCCLLGDVILGRLFGISRGGSRSGAVLPGLRGSLGGVEVSYILQTGQVMWCTEGWLELPCPTSTFPSLENLNSFKIFLSCKCRCRYCPYDMIINTVLKTSDRKAKVSRRRALTCCTCANNRHWFNTLIVHHYFEVN